MKFGLADIQFAVAALLFGFVLQGCAHQTAMSDTSLTPLWRGMPLPEETIKQAKENWPNDEALIDMQQGTNLLRYNQPTTENLKEAESYLESAYNTFDDLRDPENFSKAFTTDSQTPFRGKPYERMLTAMLIALLDTEKGRCDMALPALKSAEFLDARWQPFMFGSDAPLVYALMIRCFHESTNSAQDMARAEKGLFLALRLQLLLEPMLNLLNRFAAAKAHDPATKIAMSLLEVGIPSALLAADPDADIAALTMSVTSQAMQFLPRVLEKDEAPYDEIIRPLLKEIDSKSTKTEASANAILQVETALGKIWEQVFAVSKYRNRIHNLLTEVYFLDKTIKEAAKKPVMSILLSGQGPMLTREGSYKEIARIVPLNPNDAKAGAQQSKVNLSFPCGVTNIKGALVFTLCQGKKLAQNRFNARIKLWSSSFQAMTTSGRKFERILKGRAQFRMGTEVAAIVGGYTALALLNASAHTYDREQAQNLQTAALVVGAIAGATWLAGRASNPEADIRQVQSNFESGYLLLE